MLEWTEQEENRPIRGGQGLVYYHGKDDLGARKDLKISDKKEDGGTLRIHLSWTLAQSETCTPNRSGRRSVVPIISASAGSPLMDFT